MAEESNECGKEISLARHEYNISPQKSKGQKGQKRPRFPEDGDEEASLYSFHGNVNKKGGKGMTKWYCLCAFIWMAVIGLAAYVVPTYVLNPAKEPKLALPPTITSPTRSPAPVVTRKPTLEKPGDLDGLVDDTDAPRATPVPSASVLATKTPTRFPTPMPSLATTSAPTRNNNGNPTTSPTALPVAEPSFFPSFSPHPLRDYILSIALEGGDEFKDPDSYQSKALAWIMAQELPTNPIGDSTLSSLYLLSFEQEAKQLYALACWYYNTNGVANLATDQFWLPNLPAGTTKLPGWFDEDGWMSSAATVCTEWYGVGCNEDGLVEAIVMNDNLLSGKIPNEIGLLQDSLRYMDVRENYLANIGYEEHNFLNYLTNVQVMKLGFNYFSYDGIPPQLGAATSLVELDISYMLWYGQLKPGVFHPLLNLEYLSMGGNEYNSALPADLVQLPNLKFLYAEFTNIQGDLDFIGSLTGMEEIWIDQNGITGSIPAAIGALSSVQSMSFTLNQVSGTIPTTIGNLQSLRQIWMSHNNLTGSIPSEFSNIGSLERLHLQGNDLNGVMPEMLCGQRFPFGRLTYLQADCDGLGNVDCGQGDCCTCCGPDCPDF